MEFSKDKKYTIPSKMGGVFTIQFLRKEKTTFIFQILNKDWERELTITDLSTIKEIK